MMLNAQKAMMRSISLRNGEPCDVRLYVRVTDIREIQKIENMGVVWIKKCVSYKRGYIVVEQRNADGSLTGNCRVIRVNMKSSEIDDFLERVLNGHADKMGMYFVQRRG